MEAEHPFGFRRFFDSPALGADGHAAVAADLDGEVRNGKIKLGTSVLKVGRDAGLRPVLVLINDQIFTKTSNGWGVDNFKKGTNTNRIILFQKDTET